MKKILAALIALALLTAGCLPLVPPPPGGGHYHGEHHDRWDRR